MSKSSPGTPEKTVSGGRLHNTVVYVKQHWQLYLLFLMPAFLLTIIFRYIPMGGILIAFTEYNPIRGILDSEWVGFEHFKRFLSSPDFLSYLMNTLKLSVFGLLWGFPAPILLAFLLNRIMSAKTKQKIQLVLYILALTMLLTLFSGEFASAAGRQIIAMDEELAYEPLAESESVAYEQHDAGYAISLDRAADSVTMNVTAVPGSRGADKARLYVRTGVALKAGVAYRVSFALSSEKKLADYTVNFDGDTAAAYGKLDKRSVEAGGTDRVEYTLTPKAASGELVLRLLLGKTEVNTLRFSDLAVEEAPAEQSGANKMLVDKLNYAAPGAAVWKLKLMVATGLKPEPGKTYRFRATLNASNSGSYEICYNEGEVEKGYDVLYNQSLKSGSQSVERMIYVPTDKEDPGELIVQFSLGKLSKGTKVTVSKVTVEEASPAYTNALAKDFALNTTDTYTTYEKSWDVQKATPVASGVDMAVKPASIWRDGARARNWTC